MTAKQTAKRMAKGLLTYPAVSTVVTSAILPFAPRLGDSIVRRIPVSRRFTIMSRRTGASFEVQTHNDDMVAPLFWHGLDGWDLPLTQVLTALAPGVSVFIDVGANVGVASLVFATTNRAASVHAFEPVPLAVERMRENVILNRADGVHVHGEAVGDKAERTHINVPLERIPNGASLLERNWVETVSIPVQVITLDDFVEDSGVAAVQLMKLDTEGTEDRVVAGSRMLIERDRPTIIAEILHTQPAERLLGPMLADFGYRAWHMTEAGLKPKEAVEGDPEYRDLNYLFIHTAKAAEVLATLRKSVPVLP